MEKDVKIPTIAPTTATIQIAFGCGDEFVHIENHGLYRKAIPESQGEAFYFPRLKQTISNGTFAPRQVRLDNRFVAELVIEDWDKSHWEIKEKAVKE